MRRSHPEKLAAHQDVIDLLPRIAVDPRAAIVCVALPLMARKNLTAPAAHTGALLSSRQAPATQIHARGRSTDHDPVQHNPTSVNNTVLLASAVRGASLSLLGRLEAGRCSN
jgi:hypothetical protein